MGERKLPESDRVPENAEREEKLPKFKNHVREFCKKIPRAAKRVTTQRRIVFDWVSRGQPPFTPQIFAQP